MAVNAAERKKFELFPARLGFYPYIWLIYLVIPIGYLQQFSGIKLAVGYALIALFALTYRQLYVAGRGWRFTAWITVQLLLMVALSLFFNPYDLYLGFFTANFIARYENVRRFRAAMLLFAAAEILPLLYLVHEMDKSNAVMLLPFLVIMLLSPLGIRSLTRKQQLEKELDKANERIREMVKREERMRIARDLHDTLGHTLSLITLKSQLVEKLALKDAERAQAEAAEIRRISRAALRQVRELVSEMRAVKVAEELAEAAEMLRAAEISLEIRGDASLEGVPDLTQNILSLCIKEAVTNIVRHSGADRCRILLETADGKVRLTVEDNGRGAVRGTEGIPAPAKDGASGLQTVPAGGEESGPAGIFPGGAGNGLKGMAERLSLIDGSLTVAASQGEGTVLQVSIPLIVKEGKEGETA
ncbi:two-component system, NarL family, sensor histidine kinase DesK [Paenibacillus sophorae]|uniref:Oxygen sensor histidine kinase NreB n=1 Tax=Paenibacillus sophorae TaxID=1333845 RepID=A0A1H8PJ71_9BACL|nr:sensor histidine kinase [Paenibacillus sophorae]QWU16597.1 sensor histidine kinase [Paenibacillus sophorae]SEO41980.1 two-component system, NarL family, sensor histidine kinase DesK [Paenibacillus sophorae]